MVEKACKQGLEVYIGHTYINRRNSISKGIKTGKRGVCMRIREFHITKMNVALNFLNYRYRW